MSTTSVAVVYAVILESGFNRTAFGKGILAACFINDLGTVIALGLIFAPFTYRTLVFVGVSLVVFLVLPFVTPWFFERFGGRVSELEIKYLLLMLPKDERMLVIEDTALQQRHGNSSFSFNRPGKGKIGYSGTSERRNA